MGCIVFISIGLWLSLQHSLVYLTFILEHNGLLPKYMCDVDCGLPNVAELLKCFSVLSSLSVSVHKCSHFPIDYSSCAVFTMCKCSIFFIYRFHDGLKRSHIKKITLSHMICFTCRVDSVLRSPTRFWTTTCQSELNFQIFQSPKNFGSKLCEL